MNDHCRYCGAKRTVPVLDKRMERSPRAGNKFRAQCLGCGRWLPMTSEETFRNHHRPHVLPADADPERDDPIPLEDYDYGPEWADLVEKVHGERPAQRAVTDGGTDVVDDASSSSEPADDVVDEEPENQFECPATGCETTVEGHPDNCPGCGAGYEW